MSLTSTILRIGPRNEAAAARARERIARLTMPPWAMGRLLDLGVELAAITGKLPSPVQRKAVVVMAGDHGVTAQGVSAFPREVTVQMVHNFLAGGATINVIAKQLGVKVVVVDVGVAGELPAETGIASEIAFLRRRVRAGTADFSVGPAMTREEATQAIEVGIAIAESLGSTVDVFATGDMGIGNTTPSSALISVFTGAPPHVVTGRGTGVDDAGLARKTKVIEDALALHRPDKTDPVGVLSQVGGLEIGAIAGLILGAAAQNKPVIIDGVISTAGALLAKALAPSSVDAMVAGHVGAEPGHRVALEGLGKQPLLSLGLRLGEGTGAALAMPLVEAAARIVAEVATFDAAGVSEKSS
jgi:nicotinate-nucleotide--dimethylbenzimidazole phosphoribosyltransferase